MTTTLTEDHRRAVAQEGPLAGPPTRPEHAGTKLLKTRCGHTVTYAFPS